MGTPKDSKQIVLGSLWILLVSLGHSGKGGAPPADDLWAGEWAKMGGGGGGSMGGVSRESSGAGWILNPFRGPAQRVEFPLLKVH